MNAPLLNDTFLKACLRQATDHTPVWLMRQAGRYLPEYCATRAKAGSFMGLATNVDYATEVTLQPLDRYALDASILFSDILTVPDAMGWACPLPKAKAPNLPKWCATRRLWPNWPCPICTSCNMCLTRSPPSAKL
jgi:uroporphyrinogen decarboxylase